MLVIIVLNEYFYIKFLILLLFINYNTAIKKWVVK